MAADSSLRSVPVALNGRSYVTRAFRDELQDACNRQGISVNEFALLSMGEKLVRMGRDIPGVFKRGDCMGPANDAQPTSTEQVA